MGWIIAMALAATTWATLYFSRRCSRQALELGGAAVLVALAGYGWLGSPDQSGNPVTATSSPAAAEQAQ